LNFSGLVNWGMSVSESETVTVLVTVTARENRSLVRVQTVLDGNIAPVLVDVDVDGSVGAAVCRMY
jgi:hypothetical protein